MREAAVLFGVFIPLDMVISGHPLTWGWGVAIIGLPLLFFIPGVWLERTRLK